MPRDDYEYFVKHWHEWKSADDYVLSVQSEEYIDYNLFATLRNRHTTYIKPYQKDLDIVHGVQLDILPLDGYPDSEKAGVSCPDLFFVLCPDHTGKPWEIHGCRLPLSAVALSW